MVIGDVTRLGSSKGVARRMGGRLAAALLALIIPAVALAADGGQVLECIDKVSRESWAGSQSRETIAAVACRGIGETGADSKEFEQKVKVLRECFDKVSFRSQAKGTEAETIAASACTGVINAAETAACMDKVSRKFRYVKDTAAESLAARACARGNPAQETAVCVDKVSFRLDASGALADTLAAIACGR
jgi:hypothetical protein